MKENWINFLLIIPLIIASVFMLSPQRYNVSLTLIWSMTGIVIGFFISSSDSRDDVESVKNILSAQVMVVDILRTVQITLSGLNKEQANKFSITINVLKREIEQLRIKEKKTAQQKEIMKAFFILYLTVAIIITLLPIFSQAFVNFEW